MTLLRNGTVLVAGGYTSKDPLATAEICSPSARTFREIGVMTEARESHAATLLADGTILVLRHA